MADGLRRLSPQQSAMALAAFAFEDPDRSPWPIPDDWRERIEHARRVAEKARQRDTAWIVRYRPLHPHTTTLRLR